VEKGLKNLGFLLVQDILLIEILKMRQDPKTLKSKKWTPYDGVPVSTPPGKA